MKEVLAYDTLTEAEFAAGLLRSAGIVCEVRNDVPLERGFGSPAPMAPSVWVLREGDLSLAREVLKERPDSRGPPWNCTKCSSENGPQFDACWSCGAERSN